MARRIQLPYSRAHASTQTHGACIKCYYVSSVHVSDSWMRNNDWLCTDQYSKSIINIIFNVPPLPKFAKTYPWSKWPISGYLYHAFIFDWSSWCFLGTSWTPIWGSASPCSQVLSSSWPPSSSKNAKVPPCTSYPIISHHNHVVSPGASRNIVAYWHL